MRIGQTDRHHAIHRPGREPPVEVGPDQAVAREVGAQRLHHRAFLTQHDRFGHRPEDEADTLATGEQHRVPRKVAVLGLRIGAAQAHTATDLAEDEPGAHRHGKERIQHEQPGELTSDECTQRGNEGRNAVRIHQNADNQRDDGQRRQELDEQSADVRQITSSEPWNCHRIGGRSRTHRLVMLRFFTCHFCPPLNYLVIGVGKNRHATGALAANTSPPATAPCGGSGDLFLIKQTYCSIRKSRRSQYENVGIPRLS